MRSITLPCAVLTPYPYLSIIWFNRGRKEPSPLPFGMGSKSFQLEIIKYVKTGDFFAKNQGPIPNPQAIICNP